MTRSRRAYPPEFREQMVELERGILSQAAAWLAQETVPNSKRSSNA